MKQLVLDAGLLIALSSTKDVDYATCEAGFQQLKRTLTILLTPMQIIFEVYKWFLHDENPVVAQSVLKTIRNTLISIPIGEADFEGVCLITEAISSQWRGSLEDATVILLAQRYQSPV